MVFSSEYFKMKKINNHFTNSIYRLKIGRDLWKRSNSFMLIMQWQDENKV